MPIKLRDIAHREGPVPLTPVWGLPDDTYRIKDAQRIATRFGERILFVLESVSTQSIYHAALAPNPDRIRIVEHFRSEKAEPIGPIRVVRRGIRWVFEDAE